MGLTVLIYATHPFRLASARLQGGLNNFAPLALGQVLQKAIKAQKHKAWDRYADWRSTNTRGAPNLVLNSRKIRTLQERFFLD